MAVVGILVLAGPAAAASAAPQLGSTSGTVRTDVSDFTFSSYDADYYLSRDAAGHSTMKTVEKITAVFPEEDQNRGITRAIPQYYDGVPLETRVVSLSDTNGVTEAYDTRDDGEFLELDLGTDDYVHGSVTYTITYTQQNVVRAFADTEDDELYWDTNGTGWDQPFDRVSARVHVDPSITEFLTGDAACYQGEEGSTDTCDIASADDDTQGGTLFTSSAVNLAGGENMTVAIGFQPGTFEQVAAVDVPDGSDGGDECTDYDGNGWCGYGEGGLSLFPHYAEPPIWSTAIAIVLAILGLGGTIWAVVRRLFFGPRDAAGRGIIIPQYSVPKGLNLLEAAAIIGKPNTGVSSQIVSFAVRGNLRVLDYPVTASGADYTLQYVNSDNTDPLEKHLLTVLFGYNPLAGAVREIGITDDTLARALEQVRGQAQTSLTARGFRKKASAKGGVFVALGLVALFIVEVVFTVASGANNAFSPWMFAALPVTFIGIFVALGVSWKRGVLTETGVEQRDYLLGMRDYLELAEKDRFRVLQSPEGAERVDIGDQQQLVKLYEKLLPFAVLWGVENRWTEELAVYYAQVTVEPSWYIGSDGFNSVRFGYALSGLSQSVLTSSTPTPPPPSTSSWSGSGGGSFSGGSGGGGFSGGGGGGGGGGGR